mgnify:CR=1 FL=1
MKNLDLEKLKRENIYQTPEHLFEGVQSRVFSQLSLHKSSVSNAITKIGRASCRERV